MSGIGRTFADLELRNARAMSAGQARWDNMAPEDADDGLMSDGDALELAEDEARTTPIMPAEWLQQECIDALDAVDLLALRKGEPDFSAIGLQECDGVTVPQLVAILFGVHDTNVLRRAANELRDRFTTAHRGWMRERADDLLAAQEREIAHSQEAA